MVLFRPGPDSMKTLLVLSTHPDMVETLREGLDPARYRLLHRLGVEEAEPLLEHGLADACIIDVELTTVQGVWFLERLRRRGASIPMILYTGAKQWEWEEEAYVQGATHILTKPVRPRMLASLLDRLWISAAPPRATPPVRPPEDPPPRPDPPRTSDTSFMSVSGPVRTLSVLRDFSGILTHSLNAEGMLRQFLLMLRDILGVNRAAIFLRQPFDGAGGGSVPENRRLRAVSSIGLSTALLHHFELSFESGIGGQLFRLGRILRRSGEEVRHDVEAQKEFELLGVQVAVPVLDRETVIGLAVFDGRITGEPLVNAELELIFHLLEQLGLAVKNIWLHDQLAGNHAMMTEILRELSCGCVVVSRDLAILHANKMARKYFGSRSDRRTADLEFTDLPQEVGSRIYQVLKTGSALSNFRFEPEESPGTVFSLSVVPFHRQPAGLPASALLIAEDLTQTEQLRKLELEAGNLRFIKTMAERLTHEIGNAMVPLSTYEQLLAERWKDPGFIKTLQGALSEGVKRVNRLINQMRFLARDSLVSPEPFEVWPVIQEAFEEACRYQAFKSTLKCDQGGKSALVNGERAALKYAFMEIMINALQANPDDPKVNVRIKPDPNSNGRPVIHIEVQDNGDGFSPDVTTKVLEAFYGTRNVGLGLGLTVSHKIVVTHQGKLEILPAAKAQQHGLVRISLPLESGTTT